VNSFPLNEIGQRVKAAIPVALDAMGNDAINFILDNFQKQGFQGATFQAWDKRKHETKKSKGKQILIDKGRLRRGWRFTTNSAALSTRIMNDTPYAQIHNEGGVINHASRQQVIHFRKDKFGTRFSKQKHATHAQKVHVGSYQTKMPQRQMMGDSPVLRNKIYTSLNNIFSKAINI